MFDNRCLALTIQRTTAVAQLTRLHHIENCACQPHVTIVHTRAVTVSAPQYNNCPCGLPRHMGMCKDALREAQGRDVPKWKA